MRNCQRDLIIHLSKEFQTPTVRTIREYAGDLADAVKLTQLLPAILIIFIDGRPAAQEKEHQFDLLIITQNSTTTMLTSNLSNLDLSSNVAQYLKENYLFVANGRKGTYEVMREEMIARTILNDDRFCIIALQTFIKDYTE